MIRSSRIRISPLCKTQILMNTDDEIQELPKINKYMWYACRRNEANTVLTKWAKSLDWAAYFLDKGDKETYTNIYYIYTHICTCIYIIYIWSQQNPKVKQSSSLWVFYQ
jgi:hypothetical protein